MARAVPLLLKGTMQTTYKMEKLITQYNNVSLQKSLETYFRLAVSQIVLRHTCRRQKMHTCRQKMYSEYTDCMLMDAV